MCHFCQHSLHACMSSDWYFSLFIMRIPLTGDVMGIPPVMSSGVGIPSLTVISFGTNSKTFLCSGHSYMYQIVATFVGILCIHVWAPTCTLAYYYEDFPHWLHHGNTPVTSSGVGIPSPTIISFGTNSNTLLFIWFNPYSETFFCFFLIHVLVSYWLDK